MKKQPKQKKTFVGIVKVFNEEIRIDATHTTSRSKCKNLIQKYKSRLKKHGVDRSPPVKVKTLRVY